jgi:cyclic pyranopterin phosphate synthase
MPEEGIRLLEHKDILTFEEIFDVVSTGAGMGIEKVRITGGEPLVRKGIVGLVKMLAGISEVMDLAMTTNGILLDRFAIDLASAGLHRVNISLDTMDPEKYARITRGGRLKDVLAGIQAARDAGLIPVKLNCVINESSGEKDAKDVQKFAMSQGIQVRFIREMNLKTGDFTIVEGGEGGNCAQCNRLRLTADGMIKPCLFSDIEFSVRKMGARQAMLAALEEKPGSGSASMNGSFYRVGG